MTEHKIIFGDSRSLNQIKDKSVQLIITSPPYWQLKDYGTEDQIGFNDSYEEYINNLNYDEYLKRKLQEAIEQYDPISTENIM